jgi:hypothetical protein
MIQLFLNDHNVKKCGWKKLKKPRHLFLAGSHSILTLLLCGIINIGLNGVAGCTQAFYQTLALIVKL